MITTEDFLRGLPEIENLFNQFAFFKQQQDQYTPYNSKLLSYSQIDKIVFSDGDINSAISLWMSNVGANGITAHAGTELAKKRLLRFAEKELNWHKVVRDYIRLVATEGNAVFMLNDKAEIMVKSLRYFNIRWDKANNRAKGYDLLDENGTVILPNLQQGVEIYHSRDFLFGNYPVSPSRLDVIYNWILLDSHSVIANNKLISNGMVGITLLGLGEQASRMSQEIVDNESKKSKLEVMLEKIRNMFAGSRNAGRVGALPYLEKVFELGKSNRDMQFLELIDKAREKKLAGFGLSPVDLGVGNNTTYNNAQTFSYAIYDRIGRHIEAELQFILNSWALKQIAGITTTDNYYLEYNNPKDPDEQESQKFYLELFKNKVISLAEIREKVDFDEENIPPELLEKPEIETSDMPNATGKEEDTTVENSLKLKKKEFEVTTSPTEEALKTNLYFKFENKLTKALSKQIDDYLKEIEKYEDTVSIEVNIFKDLKKFESYYSFSALKQDLIKFADYGQKTVKKEAKERGFSLTKVFFDGEYPKEVLDYLDERTSDLLKGSKTFASLDETTASRLETIIKDNISNGVAGISQAITEAFGDLTKGRAETIAQTEVANAVEFTRESIYLENFPKGKKEWQTVKDSRVRDTHRANERQGKIGIKEKFSNGNSRAGEDIRCRCTVLYYPE